MDQTLYSLLMQDVRFLFGAETEQAQRLYELGEAVSDERLQALFTEHGDETTGQIQRLATILTEAGEEAEGDLPAAVEGLVGDAEYVADQEFGPVRDIALACAARKMEHYEIGCYESAVAIAEQLGLTHMVEPLRQSLEEEVRADARIAEVVLALVQEQIPLETESA